MSDEGATAGRGRDFALALLLLLGVAFGYRGALENGFVPYDDDVYVTDNPHVSGGLTAEGLRWAFTESHGGNRHPLTWISHMLDVELFGLEPAGHHATSVLLHAANALLLFLLLRATTSSAWASFLAAALFAWHPLRVESVAWVAERKDVLAGLFFLLALLAHARCEPAPRRRILVLVLFLLGLLAKPMLVTLPCVLLLFDVWPVRRLRSLRDARPLVREKLELFAVALGWCLVTFLAQEEAGSTHQVLPLGLRAENALASVGQYLLATVWPVGLAAFYPHAAITSDAPASALLPPAVAATVVVVLLVVLGWRLRRDRPAILVGVLWFLGTLVPVLGLVQVGVASRADRYTYLPSIGLALALVYGVRGMLRPTVWRGAAVLLGAALLIGLLLTRSQVGVWRDGRTLFTHALAVTERNYVAHAGLGQVLLEEGEPAAARRELEAALAIRPAYSEVSVSLGVLAFEAGDLGEARRRFEEAVRSAPRDPVPLVNLAGVQLELGELDPAGATLARARTVAGSAAGPGLAYHEGLLAQRRDRPEEAERAYREALSLDPRHADAWNNLGQVLLATGRVAEAAEAFATLVDLDPRDPVSHFNLGVAQEASGDRESAARSFTRALELDPQLSPAASRLEALGNGEGN